MVANQPHTPHPGMPMLWMMLMPTWAMNTKKNCMKLKELSLLKKKTEIRKINIYTYINALLCINHYYMSNLPFAYCMLCDVIHVICTFEGIQG